MGLVIGGFNGPRLGEVTGITAHGVPGCGVYILYLLLKINAGNLDSEAHISQIHCRLELGNSGPKIGDGFVEGHPVIRWTEYSTQEQLGLFFYLSANQIEAIEKSRNSGDLKVGIWLSGVTAYQGNSGIFSDKSEFIIPKQQWLEALAAMRYRDTLLFELAMPIEKSTDGDGLRGLLDRAQTHILNGHYQEAVGLCRQVIEFIEVDRGDKSAAQEVVRKYKDSKQRQEMSVDERMLFLREALKNIAHLGSHHGDEFSRKQAHAVLGMTVALLSAPEVGVSME